MIVHLETSVQLALIASLTTLAGQGLTLYSSIRGRRKARQERAALSEKVDVHNHLVAEKLDANTVITEQAAGAATQAYVEANNFNNRLLKIEQEMRTQVEMELSRLSRNIHAISNALTPLIGQLILEKKDAGKEDKKK